MTPFILALGDSLTSGHGLAPEASFPTRLQALRREQLPGATVQNAGVSGDTTQGALARLQRLLSGLRRRPDLAIVELGANGGGSFGGAGASGSCGAGGKRARPQEQRRRATSSLEEASSGVAVLPSPKYVGVAEPGSADPKPFTRIERNGYEYRIDDEKRTRSVSGTLTLSDTQARSRREQAAGLPDRRPQDNGGHYIAARFNGPTNAFNHFAQDANLNRGAYRVIEDQWARTNRNGKSVLVRIAPAYVGSSRRPSALNVWFWINGDKKKP